MKKIIICILFLLFPITVYASNVDYDIENFLIEAEVLEDGNMKVRELIVLDGTYNGYIRDIVYKNNKLVSNKTIDYEKDAIYNASKISETTIKAKKISGEVSFSTMNETFDLLNKVSSNAKNKNYTQTSIENGESFKMYYKAEKEKVAFLIEYTLNDVVVLHKDIAEVYYTFIGSSFVDRLNNVEIQLSIPKHDQNMKVWAHGELTGNINKIDERTVRANIKKLPPYSPIDIRITFDKEMISYASKKSEEEALSSILKVEEKRAEEANKKREEAKKVIFILRFICVVYLIALITWWIYVYNKYDKEYKTEFNLEYNREFIEDYNVEIVEYVMKKTIGENAFSASILNLVYKKNIKVEEIKEENKKKKVYQFTLINTENLNKTEQELINFLFKIVGKENTFTTKDLESYASSSKTYTKFQASYTKWCNSALEDAKKQNIYEKASLPLLTAFLFLIFGISMVSFSYERVSGIILPYVCAFLALIFVFHCSFMKKRTKKGAEHYAKWRTLKKFLEDFGNFDIRELPEIALWERYLVYATVFGIADQVHKTMNVKIKEIDPSNIYYSYYPTWTDFTVLDAINRSVHNSFKANHETYSREVASSSFSSGSGSGGGFSSGSGFGGGGGGGRGF